MIEFHLECSSCGKKFDANELQSICTDCLRPLLVCFDLEGIHASPEDLIDAGNSSLWRYHNLLPARKNIITLGEGFTPLLHAVRLGKELGLSNLYIKDESRNPTGSFKSRGASVAVSRAKELGVKHIVIPSAGNAAGAICAYAARAGINAHVYLPEDVPAPFLLECNAYGAEVTLVDGLLNDCSIEAEKAAREHGWFEFSTFKEPYRLEGKKTMGYEIAEQFQWELPDVIIYPTGGGIGLVGIAKAVSELAELKWISDRRPRMVSVQALGCAPIVKAFNADEEFAETWEKAHTIAPGLRAPSTNGDFLILRILRESRGVAITVTDQELLESQSRIARSEGTFACPEGGATLTALEKLIKQGWIKKSEKVVLFNTAMGIKYPNLQAEGVSTTGKDISLLRGIDLRG
jgi:threonine synthase